MPVRCMFKSFRRDEMDRELNNLKLNINQLAGLAGVCRQTAAARLKNIQPAGGHEKLKLYRVTDIVAAFLEMTEPASLDDMDPQSRKAWYQSERERLKFEQETATLIPAVDVRKELVIWGKAINEELVKLPDILERKAGINQNAVNRAREIIDDLCEQIATRVIQANDWQGNDSQVAQEIHQGDNSRHS